MTESLIMHSTLLFHRLLKAGRAKVYHFPPPSNASVTHIMAKPVTENLKSHSAPCYPVSHIVQHLFGVKLIFLIIFCMLFSVISVLKA